MLLESELRGYQKRAVDWVLHRPKSALWVDVGLGKTVSALTAVMELLRSVEIEKVLIVAPLRVSLSVWEQEIGNWAHLRGLKVSQMAGLKGASSRLAAYLQPADIYVINRELLDWFSRMHSQKKNPIDLLIFDESSSYKNPSAGRTKAAIRMCSVIPRVIELTGTPASNSLLDLWPQMFMLDGGERLGRTITEYRREYFIQSYGGFGGSWKPRRGAKDKIYEKLKDICLTMKGKEYVQLPDRINVDVVVELPKRARSLYAELEKELILAFESGEVAAINGAVLTGKLLQISNGAVYLSGGKEFKELHDEKIKAVESIIEEAPGGVMIFYQYKHDLKRLRDTFKNLVEIREAKDVPERWNRGEISILAAHPKSAGHGLNLQHGGSTMIWFGLGWSLEEYEQGCGRLHRSGQKHTVTIHHIIAKDTVEDTVRKALKGKAQTQNELMAALKEDLGIMDRI